MMGQYTMQSLYKAIYVVHRCVIKELCYKGTILQRKYIIGKWPYHGIFPIFTFSKQAFNESLDFCNRSLPHEWHKFDWQLPSSLVHAIVALNIEFIRQKWHWCCHIWVAHAKQASCLLHWLSIFKLAVLLFHFTLRLNPNTIIFWIQICINF